MPLSKFVQFSADRHEELEELALSKLPEIQSRALDLYNDPAARSDVLTKRYLFAGYTAMVQETGNEDLAARYWDAIAVMVDMSVDELASTPVGERGDMWTTAMGIILSVSMEQAQAESGLLTEAAAKGAEMGAEMNAVTRGLSKDTLKNAQFHIKTELKDRKAKKVGDAIRNRGK